MVWRSPVFMSFAGLLGILVIAGTAYYLGVSQRSPATPTREAAVRSSASPAAISQIPASFTPTNMAIGTNTPTFNPTNTPTPILATVGFYNDGVKAAQAKDWSRAVQAFAAAGDYADAAKRLQDAQAQLQQQELIYKRAQDEVHQGATWSAAIDLRQLEEIGPNYMDSTRLLSDLRAKNGKMIFVTKDGANQTAFIAEADGGNRVEVMKGTRLSAWFPSSDSRFAFIEDFGSGTKIGWFVNTETTDRFPVAKGADRVIVWPIPASTRYLVEVNPGEPFPFPSAGASPSPTPRTKPKLLIQNPDGTNAVVLADTADFMQYRVSPDGQSIFFANGTATGIQGQYHYKAFLFYLADRSSFPLFESDGDSRMQVAFNNDSSGLYVQFPQSQRASFVVNTTSRRVQRMRDGSPFAYWAPDSRSIWFLFHDGNGPGPWLPQRLSWPGLTTIQDNRIGFPLGLDYGWLSDLEDLYTHPSNLLLMDSAWKLLGLGSTDGATVAGFTLPSSCVGGGSQPSSAVSKGGHWIAVASRCDYTLLVRAVVLTPRVTQYKVDDVTLSSKISGSGLGHIEVSNSGEVLYLYDEGVTEQGRAKLWHSDSGQTVDLGPAKDARLSPDGKFVWVERLISSLPGPYQSEELVYDIERQTSKRIASIEYYNHYAYDTNGGGFSATLFTSDGRKVLLLDDHGLRAYDPNGDSGYQLLRDSLARIDWSPPPLVKWEAERR